MRRVMIMLWVAGLASLGTAARAQSLPAAELDAVAGGAGWVNTASEHIAIRLRALHGSVGRYLEGLALHAPESREADRAWAAVDAGRGFGPANALRLWTAPYLFSAVRSGANGYSHDAGGALVGLDKAFGCLTVGIAADFMFGDYDQRARRMQNEYTGLSGMVFTRFSHGQLEIELDAGLGRYWGNTHRIAPDATRIRSDMNLHEYFAALSAAYRIHVGYDWVLAPSLGVQYIRAKTPAFSENTHAYALHYGKQSHNWVRTPLFLTATRSFRGFGHLVTPYMRAGATPEWHRDTPVRRVARAGGPGGAVSDEISGARAVHWYGQAGAGFTAKLGTRTDFNMGYDFEFSRRYRNNIFNIGLGFSF